MNDNDKQDQQVEQPIVEHVNVYVRFDNLEVLRDISLAIPRGQTIAIVGESGCGKTVLLKTIIGLVKPTLGNVRFQGKDIASLSEKELTHERKRFGFLFQNAALFDSMTVGQNVAFPLRQNGDRDEEQIRTTVLARLADVGLPRAIVSKKPAELSGGMRKRVGLARALAMEPELMLYDEPTTGLDPIMGDVINELILNTRALRNKTNPITSIIVTHDMHTVRKVADRVVMIDPLERLDSHESQVVFDGTPDEMDECRDPRIWQFVRGEAGDRLLEMRDASA